MAPPSRLIKCPRCGLMNPAGATSCGACGLARPTVPSTHAAAAPTPATGKFASPRTAPRTRVVGVPAVTGVVIHADPVYMTKPEFSWGPFFLKAALALILLPFALILAVPFLILF